ncbi:hypothetical protein HNP30_004239 [Chromobacterium alkanivorans]|nr:hypothetical protein [Chromobacterium alkanivorans]
MLVFLCLPLCSFSPGVQGLPYRFKNGVSISQNIVVPEAHDAETLRLQPSVARGVAAAFMMLAAVRLYDQPRAEVDEIDDVGADYLLAAEFLAVQPVSAELLPEQLFGIGHVAAQGFGEIELAHPPLPNPSPAGGEGLAESLTLGLPTLSFLIGKLK